MLWSGLGVDMGGWVGRRPELHVGGHRRPLSASLLLPWRWRPWPCFAHKILSTGITSTGGAAVDEQENPKAADWLPTICLSTIKPMHASPHLWEASHSCQACVAAACWSVRTCEAMALALALVLSAQPRLAPGAVQAVQLTRHS